MTDRFMSFSKRSHDCMESAEVRAQPGQGGRELHFMPSCSDLATDKVMRRKVMFLINNFQWLDGLGC